MSYLGRCNVVNTTRSSTLGIRLRVWEWNYHIEHLASEVEILLQANAHS